MFCTFVCPLGWHEAATEILIFEFGFALHVLQKHEDDSAKLTPRGKVEVKTAATVCIKKVF